jgi:hypothetical protein
MNKLIEELAQQAEKYAEYYAMLSDLAEKEIFTERFANLIVLECIPFVGDEDSLEVFHLKKHFGVEK